MLNAKQKHNAIVIVRINYNVFSLFFSSGDMNKTKQQQNQIKVKVSCQKREKNLFDQEENNLQKFKADSVSNDDIVRANAALKLELRFVTSQEQTVITDYLQYPRGRNWPRARGRGS